MAEERKPNKYNEISQKYGDPWIWGIFIMLVIISIVESYSASSREILDEGIYKPVIKQCAFLACGAGLVFWLRRVNYNNPLFLYLMVPVLAIGTVVSLIYVMKFGEIINGARRSMPVMASIYTRYVSSGPAAPIDRMCRASRRTAYWSRLPRMPRMSFFTMTGFFNLFEIR